MLISKPNIKLSIIASIIINSSYSYAVDSPKELIETEKNKFKFEFIERLSLKEYPSNKHIHGRMETRDIPVILTSKYQNTIIVSDDNKINISHDLGKSFKPLEINGFNNIKAISLSENGRYLTAHGEHKNNSDIFFVYDIYLKETTLFNNKNNISYVINDDYYLTTEDGLFSLYSEDKDLYSHLYPINEKIFFIFDNKNKKTVPLSDIDNTELKNHIEKNRFIAFNDLSIFNNYSSDQNPNITGISYSGKYIYGTQQRDNQNSPYIRLAFIYDKEKNKIELLSNSEYGSSKINHFSKNDIAVGWVESLVKRREERNERLIRQAFIYNPNIQNNDKFKIPRINSSINYYNSEATAISEKGDFFVGWAEYGDGDLREIKELRLSQHPRKAFAYFIQDNHSILLPSFQITNYSNHEESEAHSISKDGNTIFGISKKQDDKWYAVAWYLDKNKINTIEQEKEKINIFLDTILAKKDIKSAQDHFNTTKIRLNTAKTEYDRFLFDLENQLQETTKKHNEAIENKERIEKIIDDGGDEAWKKYSNKYHEYESDVERYSSQLNNLQEQVSTSDNSQIGRKLQIVSYEHKKNQQILAELQKDKQTINIEPNTKDDIAEQARLDKEQADKAKAEQARLDKEQADKAKAEQARLDKEQADKAKAEQERLDKEQANKAKAEQTRLDKEQADKAKAEQARLDKEQADKAKAEQARLDKEQADKAKAEQARLDKEQADKAKAEQARLDKEQADKAKAEQARLDKEQADKAKAEQARLDKEQADKAKAEQARLDKEQADKAKAEQARLDKEQADKAKELTPVEDELAQRAKEKAKEKETAKPSITVSKPIDIENTYKSMQLMAENGYKLMDMQQGQLHYLASATCSVGTEKACISGFAHYQNVNKANATQTGLSGAYRFDVNHIPLVIGLAIDTDVYSSLPKGYQYQGYTLPLIGFSLDLIPSLNPELKSNALHLSLKGAYLNRKISIERQVLEDTEAGKGNARISGYHIDLQSYYPYSLADDLMLTPFIGLTFNQVSRSAYSETQNAQFAAHYEALKTHSLLAKMGLGMDYLLGSSFILNTKAGLLWNLSHHQGDFRSHIDYLGQQHIDYSENKKQLKQRPFAKVGLTYQLDKQSSINTSADWEMTTYRNHDMQFGVSYTYRF
ncbi:autotransporter domain-containing protein [Proteus penneri]|uniref:Autotransporter beta-domain protein n=1 Tax=Proteus penneri TaxID=102862 RepID=A0A0G4QCV2_9GAMM|nr:autotransporter domain-containing protein [Proteus penneri]CRL63675.1 Autotransporter beta-domain protein [Proteus penneri]